MPRVPIALLAAAALAAALLAAPGAEAQGTFVSANATVVESGDFVDVSFGGVPFGQREGCWIGVFSPPGVDVSAIPPVAWPASEPWVATAAIKYAYCRDDPEFVATGRGSRAFVLLNMREDVEFVLFTNDTAQPVARARSAPVAFKNPGAPQHAHLSRTDAVDEMRLSWGSASAAPARVLYGYASGQLTLAAPAKTATYAAEDMCGVPATTQGWRDPGQLHSAVMTGLRPGATVYYRFGSDASGLSDERHFVAPTPPSPHRPTSALVFADMGASEVDQCLYHWGEPAAFETIKYVTDEATGERSADLLLNVGDLAYATGYSAKWDLYLSVIEEAASRVPIMTGLGNHERTWPGTACVYNGTDSGGECGVPTEARFPMPVPGGNQSAGWWSLDEGSMHLVMLNTELSVSPDSPQFRWLAADLAAVNRSVTPWLVLMGHRPMYHDDTIDANLQQFEELLFENRVDLCLWGHVHYAQVTCPVYKGQCRTAQQPGGYDAPVHAVIGNGGMGFSKMPAKTEPWSKFVNLEWGYQRLTAYNASTLELDLFYDMDNALHHSVVIERSFPRA